MLIHLRIVQRQVHGSAAVALCNSNIIVDICVSASQGYGICFQPCTKAFQVATTHFSKDTWRPGATALQRC